MCIRDSFKNMGIKLNSVVSSAVAEIMSVDCLSYIKGKTCIIQGLDGMSLTNILYVNGAYFQYNSSRIFGERGTPAFGIECARSISNMQQFLKTQQVDEVMTHVYLGGEFQDEDVEICRESIQQMDDSLDVEKLYEEQDGAVRFQADGHVWFENFIMMMGGLLAPRGKSNLFYQYSQDRETVRRHRELLRYVIPVALAAFLLGGKMCIRDRRCTADKKRDKAKRRFCEAESSLLIRLIPIRQIPLYSTQSPSSGPAKSNCEAPHGSDNYIAMDEPL